MPRKISIPIYGNALILITLATYFFISPAAILIRDLYQVRSSPESIQPFVFDWHESLSPEFEAWARERVASAAGAELSVNNISGTEWPMFSAVFYLWATEALQLAWEEDPSLASEMPKVYAQPAIEASAALIADPNNATWVKIHWGEDYLERENLFYRMLLISGLTSYQKLTGDTVYQPLLLSQVESLAAEIDRSPYGMLDDYPGQYYSIDMLPAIAAIQRADAVLGSDHSEFVRRARRAFSGALLDPRTGLPTYTADSKTGIGYGPSRGVGAAFMLIWASELWPETAEHWYASFEDHFWQETPFFAGFREFSNQSSTRQWFIDVDAGPVVVGYGTAATAFGIGAARVNGRFNQAYPLTAQALAASWPLPNGTRLGPRLLSNLSDAPYVGEAALLFTLTRQPDSDALLTAKGGMPMVVYFIVAAYMGLGVVVVGKGVVDVRRWRLDVGVVGSAELQLAGWGILVVVGLLLIATGHSLPGLLFLLVAQFLPIKRPV
jgi:hypothetical protein